jgi:hypothetical protein
MVLPAVQRLKLPFSFKQQSVCTIKAGYVVEATNVFEAAKKMIWDEVTVSLKNILIVSICCFRI